MAYVSLSKDEKKVIGLYNSPQNAPQPEGYTTIPDDDERLEDFCKKHGIRYDKY